MKYEIEFVSKIQDALNRNTILIFGETDIKGIAEKCFEYGKSGNFKEIRLTRVKKDG